MIKITIEGPQGSGKTAIRRMIEEILAKDTVPPVVRVYDPAYRYKPEQINFEGADVVIFVKTKTPKKTHASDCALHNGPAYEPGPCDCGADPAMTPDRYGSEYPINHGSASKGLEEKI